MANGLANGLANDRHRHPLRSSRIPLGIVQWLPMVANASLRHGLETLKDGLRP